MAVIGVDDRDDLAFLGGVARGLDRESIAWRRPPRYIMVLHTAAADLGEHLRQRGPTQSREMMVPHVEARGAAVENLDQFRMAMADIVGAAIQMNVDQPPSMSMS